MFDAAPNGAPGYAAAGIAALGQRVQAAPSPAGWSDRADDWLGPDAVWKRVEWATRFAERAGKRRRAPRRRAEPRPAARRRDDAPDRARRDGPQALALLLLAPEFQRR